MTECCGKISMSILPEDVSGLTGKPQAMVACTGKRQHAAAFAFGVVGGSCVPTLLPLAIHSPPPKLLQWRSSWSWCTAAAGRLS